MRPDVRDFHDGFRERSRAGTMHLFVGFYFPECNSRGSLAELGIKIPSTHGGASRRDCGATQL
jgi:hypothetical protein